jgi:hypothetical protein
VIKGEFTRLNFVGQLEQGVLKRVSMSVFLQKTNFLCRRPKKSQLNCTKLFLFK